MFIGRLGAALALLIALPLRAQEEETRYPETAAEEGYAYEYQDEALIEAALEETLSQPEFARLRVEPEPEKEESGETAAFLDRFFEWLARALWGGDAREEPASGLAFSLPGARLLVYAMAFVILAAAVFFVARSVLAISREGKTTEVEAAARVFGPETAPGELDPEEYWRRALAHGENRRFKEGTRELLLGAMSALERRGLVRFRRGLTNRDYFYAVRGPARESFGSIASAFEHIYFGRREATGDAFRESCRAYQKSFREAAT
jgi:hypothetical protein